ncbi:MAG: DUF541 domain-containing protein [Planctomycetes bacterium]|nr:DUF541 domain-containing protein [Planctomycetota bacterium]
MHPERGSKYVAQSIFNVHVRFFCLTLIGVIATQDSKAQDTFKNGSGISVTATQQVKITASKLRLQLPIRVEARDEASVLKTMKKHQEAVRNELKALGVDNSAIEFSSPLVTAGIPEVDDLDASRRAARNHVIQMRAMNPTMRGQFPLPVFEDEDDSELPIVCVARATLVADWGLDKESEEAAVLLPSKVKRLYEQKDLTGKKFRVELTEDEQSLIEPLLGSSSYVSFQRPISPSNRLYYVGELLPEQEKAAYAEAMNKARARAELIAQSSGLRLGKIRSIQTSTGSEPIFQSMSAMTLMQSESEVSTPKEENEREVTGTDFDGLTKRIQLVVVFDFE